MIAYIQILTAFFLSMLLVYILIPAIVRLSIAKKLFDLPNERRVNKTVIPNLGGVALFIAISISSLLCIYRMQFPDLQYIIAAMIIIFFTGLKDDILIITPLKKFLAQIVTAIILIGPGDIRLTNFHGIFGIYAISYVYSFLISVLIIVAVINAFNLIDGIDGLATSLGILISGFFGVVFSIDCHYQYAILSFSIMGSLFAFFPFNVFGKANKIFMGDTGSLLLGVLIAILLIKYNEFAVFSPGNNFYYSSPLSLAVISIPLFDMVRVFCVRIYHKKSPFLPDMNHIHHVFIRLGFSHLKSTMIICWANLLIVCLIYVFREANIHILFIMAILLESIFTLSVYCVYWRWKSKNISEK